MSDSCGVMAQQHGNGGREVPAPSKRACAGGHVTEDIDGMSAEISMKHNSLALLAAYIM